MSRIRSTPNTSAIPSSGIPKDLRMIVMLIREAAGTAAVPKLNKVPRRRIRR